MTKTTQNDDVAHLKSTGGPMRILNAIHYSSSGLKHALQHEAAFRQECVLAIPAMIGCWWSPISTAEKLVLFGATLAVLVIEILNSAVEATVDRISTERHPLAGRAKDMGSAAVMLTILFAGLCWLLIAGPHFLHWIRT